MTTIVSHPKLKQNNVQIIQFGPFTNLSCNRYCYYYLYSYAFSFDYLAIVAVNNNHHHDDDHDNIVAQANVAD